MNITLYGIPNCDTVRKARGWLDAQGFAYRFHDYKKAGIEPAKLRQWTDARGWEAILNRAGTTFRKLPEGERSDLDAPRAIALMCANPSAIKRPVIEIGREGMAALLVGFDPQKWSAELGNEIP